MNRKMMEFAQVVSNLNEMRRHRQPYAVISQFLETTLKTKDRDNVGLLHSITNIPGQAKRIGRFLGFTSRNCW